MIHTCTLGCKLLQKLITIQFSTLQLPKKKRGVVNFVVFVLVFIILHPLWNKHCYDHTVQLSISYHCSNANSSPVLIPVYLASANPMTQRNSTAIHALTNMQIATAMSHICLCFHPIAASQSPKLIIN